MELSWTKAEFKSFGALQGLKSDLMRLANENLARELAIRLSAFLQSSFSVTYLDGGVEVFGDLTLSESASSFGLALLREDGGKLVVELENAALYPLLGVALGAKNGNFASPERRPTEIELQVFQMLLRLILGEVSRAWSSLGEKGLDVVAIEIEPRPARTWAATEPLFAARFQLGGDQPLGLLRIIAPLGLVSGTQDEVIGRPANPSQAAIENTLETMLSAQVSMAVWLEGSQMLLGDLLQLRRGQIVKLDQTLESSAMATVNGEKGFTGQIVSTGSHRAFLVERLTDQPL